MSRPSCGIPETRATGLEPGFIRKLETNNPRYFIETVPQHITPQVYSKACAEAFGIWSKVGLIVFTEVFQIEEADIVVTMKAMPKKVMGSYILATGSYPNDPGEVQYITLNSLRRWTVSASKYVGLMDVRHTLRHESGHIIGLEHAPDGPPKEIMDRHVNKDIYVPSKREARLVAKYYGPPKMR
jgi:predicted Zn-dependent protease